MRTPTFWHRPSPVGLMLTPLGLLYLLGVWLDRTLTQPRRAGLPVVSVGNVTAGGAGKTPAAIALATLLKQQGETPHILTRGYGGVSVTPHEVRADSDWRRVGDEPLLLAAAAPTWVGRDRLFASTLAAEHGASLLLADDALQHHRLYKDISLVVIDGAYGMGNHLPLPAGPMRESLAAALARSHAVVLIGEDTHQLLTHVKLPVFRARLEPAHDTAFLKQGKWLAFAGLARPQKFFDTLRSLGAELAGTESFADHYPYHARDIKQLLARAGALKARPITTEKDAVKIPAHLRAEVAVLKVALRFDDEPGLIAWLKQALARTRA